MSRKQTAATIAAMTGMPKPDHADGASTSPTTAITPARCRSSTSL